MASRATTLAELRAHLAAVAPMRTGTPPTSTGWGELDAAIGGWPRPGVAAIYGAVGTGRMGVILPSLQHHTQAGRTVALVDPLGWCHPPGLPGVDLRHLMLIRCGGPQAGWAAIQLAASGAVPLVVLLDPPPLAGDARRLLCATESGDSTAIVLTERPDARLTTPVRIHTLGGGQIRIERGALGQPAFTLS
jgi:hypothetical protein